MTDYEQWLAANDRFLAGTMTWLRDRLERLAREGAGEPSGGPVRAGPAAREGATPARRRGLRFSRHVESLPAPGSSSAVAEVQPPDTTGSGDPEDLPPLVQLTQRLGLTTFERNVLVLAVSTELDTRIAALCARAQRDPERAYPTFALAMTLFDQPAWDVVSPERPLRHWLLVDVARDRADPLVQSRLRADDRVVSHIKGLDYVDERLQPLLRAVPTPEDADLAPSQHLTARAILSAMHRTSASARAPLVQLVGADATGRRLVAALAARELGLQLLEVSAEDLPTVGPDGDQLARLWHRESLLSPVGLYVDATDADKNGPSVGAVRRWLYGAPGLVMVDLREPWPELGDGSLVVDVTRPTPAEQRTAWREALGEDADHSPERLAGQFDLNLPAIRRVAREARARDDGPDTLAGSLWAGSLAESRTGLDQLAQRLDTVATWDDLKLPPTQERLLHEIAGQVAHRSTVYDTFGFRDRMNRGLGISVLFAGESGTGKTMAAEVLANALGLMLYRIDLSAVVSKYIGETEKNLRKLFDAADGGGAILFFDEADALFGKRSEVKDSHDRYANIEINYLLQRMETFRGLAILATNLKSAMDTAFLRRLRFVVDFPFPAANERAAIWAGVLPTDTPRAELDLTRLARLNVTGGSIQNIAVNAAFAAAREDEPVSMPLLLDAARTEFRKLDKPVNEADFGWLEPAGGST